MPTIRVKENEPFEVALRRFKRTIEKSGLLTELRAREFYENRLLNANAKSCRYQASLQASSQHDAPEEALLILQALQNRGSYEFKRPDHL